MPTCVVGAERTEVTSAVVIFIFFFFVGILSVKCSCQRQLVHLDQSCWTRRFFIDLNMVFNFSTIFYLLVITSRQREFSNFSFLDFLLSTWSARVRRALGALGRPKKKSAETALLLQTVTIVQYSCFRVFDGAIMFSIILLVGIYISMLI